MINTSASLTLPTSSPPPPSLRPPSTRSTHPRPPYPYSISDFENPDAFSSWKKQETDELQELLLDMTVRNPLLVQNGIKGGVTLNNENYSSLIESRRSSRSSLIEEEGPVESGGGGLTFVPPDPTYYFRRLYELLLHHDYSLMSSLPPDEDVSLSILSPLHESLLESIRQRWRIPTTLKSAVFVGLVAGLYKGMGVPEECVGEALDELERTEKDWRYWRWPLIDVRIPFLSPSSKPGTENDSCVV